MEITFSDMLKRLVQNRNRTDLHSAMCYFKSGRVAYITANYDKTLWVNIKDEYVSKVCRNVAEVLDMFEGEELIRFET